MSKNQDKLGKQPKKLTLFQKKMISSQGYDATEYMYHRETETQFIFKHKKNGFFLEIDK